ncbi:MAG: FtsQ-type POTRA domain-containing protein [Alphaproteobacteria bacterium]|nr:FtsQ-type POTRA domain-containing protein [Alphaproteobacteria bacterium]MBQ8677685.1 FtsQ-type POTRA domain-containing protein [Alphaproteobacteria bacterium]
MGNKTIRYKKINKNQPIAVASAPVLISPQIWLPQIWIYRFIGNLILLALIIASAFCIFTIKSNLIGKQLGTLSHQFYTISGSFGFNIDDVIISGRHHTSKDELALALDIDRNSNIMQLDLSAIKEKLENLPWIKKVNLHRSYFPNILQIDIQEREVKSIWQFENNFYPIDAEGNIIDAEYIPTSPVLLIVGAGAPENIKDLMTSIQDNEEIFKRIKVANFISKRRWNIVLDDVEHGITVKLPEDNIHEAWQKLLNLHKTVGILKRKLTIIDLRLQGKVIVRLRKSELDSPQQLKEIKEHKI